MVGKVTSVLLIEKGYLLYGNYEYDYDNEFQAGAKSQSIFACRNYMRSPWPACGSGLLPDNRYAMPQQFNHGYLFRRAKMRFAHTNIVAKDWKLIEP